MLEPNKDSQIERSWLQHDPARGEIPADVWRSLRSFKRELLPTAGIIEGVLKKEKLAQSIVEPAVRRRGVARQRKLTELRRLLPGANVSMSFKEILEVSWLSPKPAILANPGHQGEEQDCLLTCYLVAFPPTPHSITCHSAWAAEIPDHAAARFMQRAPKSDLRDALFAAGLSFLAADAESVVPLVGKDVSIYLPAGPGSFACTVIGARTVDGRSSYVYARANTWLSDAMLRADQTPLPRAASAEGTVALRVSRWDQNGMVVPTFTKGGAAPVATSGLLGSDGRAGAD